VRKGEKGTFWFLETPTFMRKKGGHSAFLSLPFVRDAGSAASRKLKKFHIPLEVVEQPAFRKD
jgi:hypothetical protein